MPSEIFVDTQFVIVLANRRDSHHDEAQELARVYLTRQLVTTDAVLLEIGNGLARGLRQQAATLIEGFRQTEGVEVVNLTPALFDRAFELYINRPDKEWGLVDCLSFVVMEDRAITDSLTYDRHFIQAGFVALMRIES